ncbi:unnamed protein product [Candida verbasci]|uniref:Uncharacterized protein n=1 Tax=Candida verbasci TaxID=1227364 RepID=A0A9W4XJD8_9ASCO|nr:unnamed protein product [Candida verbasci]
MSDNSIPLNNYQYLLKTENLEPLKDYVIQLTKQISENQQKLNELVYTIDEKLRYPIYLPSKEQSKDTDEVRYILTQKYDLPEPKKDRKETLKLDIAYLKNLLVGKKKKNQELLSIVHDYEEFIASVIPSLIESLKDLDSSNDDVLSEIHTKKNELVDDLYSKYVKNVEKIDLVASVVNKFLKLVDDNDDSRVIEGQLMSLNRLKDKLQNGPI